MALLYSQTKLICSLMLALMLIGNVRTQQITENADAKEKIVLNVPAVPDTPKEPKTFKKELRLDKTQVADNVSPVSLPLEPDNAAAIAKEKSPELKSEVKEKVKNNPLATDAKENSPELKSDDKEKNIIKPAEKEAVKSLISQSTTTTKLPAPVHHFHHEDDEFVLNDEEDISNSLTTGFYFFLALSSGAVLFILFKIYRLRLSRAERKYGVQGDRSNQELTPLPISIEDGHSDDDEQIVFEAQRQNIRIL